MFWKFHKQHAYQISFIQNMNRNIFNKRKIRKKQKSINAVLRASIQNSPVHVFLVILMQFFLIIVIS
uniref:Uncharacterized protein n=1 Tax=Octopus bimaculoides TaxID=37653 RepID=A0A0L8HLF6_OCTBM